MKVLAGTSNLKLCKNIARQLKLKLVNSHIKRFADGEVYIEINENNESKAKSIAEEMCKKLLANLVIEDFKII